MRAVMIRNVPEEVHRAIRVLPFDMACTRAYADVLTAARKSGRGIEAADAVIAAIALDNGFSVATRDASPFLAAGVK